MSATAIRKSRVARPRPRRHQTQRTLATVIALSRHRATYRQLDYWAATGRIDIGERPGTGNWRVLSPAEMCAILDVIDENQRLIDEGERVRSGEFFRDRLAHHVEHETDPFTQLRRKPANGDHDAPRHNTGG